MSKIIEEFVEFFKTIDWDFYSNVEKTVPINTIHTWAAGRYQKKAPGIWLKLTEGGHNPYRDHNEALRHMDHISQMAERAYMSAPAGNEEHRKAYEELTHLFGRLGIYMADDDGIRRVLEPFGNKLIQVHSQGEKTGHFGTAVLSAIHPRSTLGRMLRQAVHDSVLNPKVAARERHPEQAVAIG